MNPLLTPSTTASHTRRRAQNSYSPPDFLSMDTPEFRPTNLASGSNANAFNASAFNPGNTSGTNYSEFSVATSSLFKNLSKSAYTFHVPKLKYDSDPRMRRDAFLTWIDILNEVFFTRP